MKKSISREESGLLHLVPNNSQADLQLTQGGDCDSKVKARSKKRTLFDSSYSTVAGHWKDRDEPDEAEQLRQSDRIRRHLLAGQQRASRERLKRKGVVPTKKGQKLFDQFLKEARTTRKTTIKSNGVQRDLENLWNTYNAAAVLSFDQWVMLMSL